MIPPRDDTNVVFDYGDCIYINILYSYLLCL